MLAATTLGQRRAFFGIGEIVGVLTNPAEVVRNLTESRKLLEEARQDIKDMRERAQLPPKHTFSPLPGFFERKREMKAIERSLSGVPSFTVLFGASSVGKSVLCRQILCRPEYHCLSFDLRLAGFADLSSLYFTLSAQMEQYFVQLSKLLKGYEEFEKESFAFKHDRIAVEKRTEAGGEVKTADVARVLELFQSALIKYWAFEPALPGDKGKSKDKNHDATLPNPEASLKSARSVDVSKDGSDKSAVPGVPAPRVDTVDTVQSEENEEVAPKKLIPVLFFDEAHRLPLLIQDRKAMKCILDAMLVLTKQDRLCHVVAATSDPFYMHWLRQMNIMQHCKIQTIGDVSKIEAEAFFKDKLLPDVPEKLRSGFNFEDVYRVFGGKLAHLSDYAADYVNADGRLEPKASSHYAQAHALLNLQLIHASPALSSEEEDTTAQAAGFGIYSPLRPTGGDDNPTPQGNDFTPMNLLEVCKRLLAENALPYFPLCRELGARAVDGLVKGRILELRWVESITPEGDIQQSNTETGPVLLPTTPVIRSAMRQVVEEWQDYMNSMAKNPASRQSADEDKDK